MNFNELIDKNKEKHAYVLGAKAFTSLVDSKSVPNKVLVSPFEQGSAADNEWLEGYCDAFFVSYGYNLND